jgi:hypothetical protein
MGIPDSQIILMLADDMACNPRNSYPAQVNTSICKRVLAMRHWKRTNPRQSFSSFPPSSDIHSTPLHSARALFPYVFILAWCRYSTIKATS